MIEYLDIDKFINKKADLYNFVNPFFNEKYRESHNFFYIMDALLIYKNYLDNLFLKVDSNIRLDINQKIAVLSQNKNVLIIAGAGSGKTTTVAAKIKFMVDILKINPSEILLLSYTNEAVLEMKKIICDKFDIVVTILTFHKFAILLTQNKKKIVENIGFNFNTFWSKFKVYLYLYLFYDLTISDIRNETINYITAFNDMIKDCNKKYYERASYK